MKTQRSSSMYRSGTMPISLPKISKLNVKQSRYNDSKNRSSFHLNISKARNSKSFIQSKSPFTTRVQQQVLDQNQYPYIQTSNIQKQHGKLKDLLKQFNQQTVDILQKYVIDKPIKKQHVKKKHPIQQIHHIRNKESQNAHNMIMILKYQIQKLESRCENLKYTSKEEFQFKIKQLKSQKHKILTQNKEVSRQITLNGLQIVKGKQSITKQLEYQQYLIDIKHDKLKKQSESVLAQIKSLQQKTKQINQQIEKYEQQESYTLKQYEQVEREKSQNRLYEQLSKKRKLVEHNKFINQSVNYQLKHKYFQRLKQLDEFNNKDESFNKQMYDFDSSISEAKNIINQLERKQAQYGNKYKEQVIGINGKINFNQTKNARININLK